MMSNCALSTGAEPGRIFVPIDPLQAEANYYRDAAVPCAGQIGSTPIHPGFSFVDVLTVAARYLVASGRRGEFARSRLPVREYLGATFGVVTANASRAQAHRDRRLFKSILWTEARRARQRLAA